MLNDKQISLSLKWGDLVNTVIVKGCNFLLVFLIFLIARTGLDSNIFIDFGFYWSVSLLIGGILLGGASSAFVRFIGVSGSFKSFFNEVSVRLSLMLLFISVLLSLLVSRGSVLSGYSLYFQLFAFGLIMQMQMAVITLMRALNSMLEVTVTSSIMLVVSPLFFFIMFDEVKGDLSDIFSTLVTSFIFSFFLIIGVCYKQINKLYQADHEKHIQSLTVSQFLAAYYSFTAINIFSYSFTTMDFYILREIKIEGLLEIAGTAKIYFDRFVTPTLSVFAATMSIGILRTKSKYVVGNRDIEIDIKPSLFSMTKFIALGLVCAAGYFLFVSLGNGVSTPLNIGAALVITSGYIIYVINSVLFDVMVLKHNARFLIISVTIFLICAFPINYFSIRLFGLAGWVFYWPLMNLVVLLFLYNYVSRAYQK